MQAEASPPIHAAIQQWKVGDTAGDLYSYAPSAHLSVDGELWKT